MLRVASAVEMTAFAVVVEDYQDLGGAAVAAEGVGGHGGERGGLAGLDADDAFAEVEDDGAGQHGEPVPAGMDTHVVRGDAARLVGDAHLADGQPLGAVVLGEEPGGQAAGLVAVRSDDDIGVIWRLDELVERFAQRRGDGGELVEADAAMPGLNAAELRRADARSLGEVVQ